MAGIFGGKTPVEKAAEAKEKRLAAVRWALKRAAWKAKMIGAFVPKPATPAPEPAASSSSSSSAAAVAGSAAAGAAALPAPALMPSPGPWLPGQTAPPRERGVPPLIHHTGPPMSNLRRARSESPRGRGGTPRGRGGTPRGATPRGGKKGSPKAAPPGRVLVMKRDPECGLYCAPPVTPVTPVTAGMM